MSGWVDLQSEKAPRPSSSVVLDMSTGQPSVPKGINLNTNYITFNGEKLQLVNAAGTIKCTIGYDSVTDQVRIISQDTTDLQIEGNANTVIVTGGGRLGKIAGLTRAIDTVYQNNLDELLHVQWSFVLAAGDTVSLLADDANPPTTVRCRVSNGAGNADIRSSISEIILNDEYYKFDITAGTPTVSSYREIRIFGDPA